jgi:hypothetical protein
MYNLQKSECNQSGLSYFENQLSELPHEDLEILDTDVLTFSKITSEGLPTDYILHTPQLPVREFCEGVDMTLVKLHDNRNKIRSEVLSTLTTFTDNLSILELQASGAGFIEEVQILRKTLNKLKGNKYLNFTMNKLGLLKTKCIT